MTHNPPEYCQCDHGYEQCKQYQTEIAALRASRQAMADALERILTLVDFERGANREDREEANQLLIKARASLSHKGE